MEPLTQAELVQRNFKSMSVAISQIGGTLTIIWSIMRLVVNYNLQREWLPTVLKTVFGM